ncbi:thiamine pyrophosphate-binding protein [Pelagibacterium halotolerans]|uniref:TPP-requiring enzyme co-localized with fatty acid metabolic genes n=1 Tax=Pelagibacterium halotolerans (strain DSM 22347 / JCM 15775 / CGMCC 1.7692 / B2) TaxID=1082931 RepID=G4RCE6_PELHB|nr:thiamine pyrophosphate-binding protein [Pelagibacterium halotolerans]AEQ53740.1 TPP-requiring enzyme co-localized with fatty acid metabolic genes [Pelagibacterium halotolerans B2]QJR20097.1 thiamine pyrophosphate-binding protein [Pelagibacterium halotolerans]SEA79976.1 Acetolactate synthase large subunit [Pelagibacterium halotolerans]
MTTLKTYDVLAKAFVQEDVDTCFALLGDANMNWGTTLSTLGVRMIYVRHEHCAVASAMAYARKSGKTGVATVTCGPGLTQLMTALPAAVRANLPLVIFAGEAPLKSGWYNQGIDQAPFITATGAIYRSLHHIERMPEAVRDAFLDARMAGKPVVLGVPFDLQDRDWPGEMALPAPSATLIPDVGPVPPHPDDIARAADRVARAKKIVVMAGMGAVSAGAGQACRKLAEKCDGLLATTLPARGLFCDDPYCLGVAGGFSTEAGRQLMAEADLIIAVGSILAHHNADGGKLFGSAHVLQIDLDPVTVSQGRVAAHSHVRADARLGVEALNEKIEARLNHWRNEETARFIRETPPDSEHFPAAGNLLDPRAVVAALETHLPPDWEMVNSSGHCSYFFAQMPSRPQHRFLTIREFGAIGNGISFAMGVAAARPDDTVVLFDGDGSLMMHIQEIETIARHGLNILICILNDGAYGSEIHKLRAEGLSDEGAVFGRSDFASIARGFGIGGETITDLSALPSLIEGFRRRGGAAIWDFPISDQVISPVIRRAHPPVTYA